MLLYSLCKSCRELTADQRIFREILKVSSAKNIPVNIQRRSQPQIDTENVHLAADYVSAHFGKCGIPALGNCRCDRDRGTVLFFERSAGFWFRLSADDFFKSTRQHIDHGFRQRQSYRMLALFIFVITLRNSYTCRSVGHYNASDALAFISAA